MRLDGDIAVQVAVSGVIFAGLAFADDANGLAFVDAGGDFYVDDTVLELAAAASAIGAEFAHDGAAAAAIGAGGDHAEHAAEALLGDAALAAALGAGDGRGAGLGAGAFAIVAGILTLELDFFLSAVG